MIPYAIQRKLTYSERRWVEALLETSVTSTNIIRRQQWKAQRRLPIVFGGQYYKPAPKPKKKLK